MKEIKQILRYVLPGAVTVLLWICVSAILNRSEVLTLVVKSQELNLLGILFGGLLLVAGIGYILGNAYFFCYNFLGIQRVTGIDRRSVVREFKECPDFALFGKGVEAEIESQKLSPRRAWELFTVVWVRARANSIVVQAACKYTERLVDIAHGLGATAMGIVLIVIVLVMLPDTPSVCTKEGGLTWLLLVSVFCIACFNICATLRSVERIEGTFLRMFLSSPELACPKDPPSKHA